MNRVSTYRFSFLLPEKIPATAVGLFGGYYTIAVSLLYLFR